MCGLPPLFVGRHIRHSRMVTIGSVFSLINAIFSMNIFVLASWIAVIGVVFKFLRKEYVILFLIFHCRSFGAVPGKGLPPSQWAGSWICRMMTRSFPFFATRMPVGEGRCVLIFRAPEVPPVRTGGEEACSSPVLSVLLLEE